MTCYHSNGTQQAFRVSAQEVVVQVAVLIRRSVEFRRVGRCKNPATEAATSSQLSILVGAQEVLVTAEVVNRIIRRTHVMM